MKQREERAFVGSDNRDLGETEGSAKGKKEMRYRMMGDIDGAIALADMYTNPTTMKWRE